MHYAYLSVMSTSPGSKLASQARQNDEPISSRTFSTLFTLTMSDDIFDITYTFDAMDYWCNYSTLPPLSTIDGDLISVTRGSLVTNKYTVYTVNSL